MVHINKGRLHAFRKLSTHQLAGNDCHATLRADLVKRMNLEEAQVCISVAWDWMYRGVSEGGIAREVSATMTCASLNRLKPIKSLGMIELPLLLLSRSICDSKSEQVKGGYQPSKEVTCRGILPGLRLIVGEQRSLMERAQGRLRVKGTGIC